MSDNNSQKGQSQMNPSQNALHSSVPKVTKESPIDFYKKDKKFVFIYKKTEKLISAIYLLTSFFDIDEPLRRELRASAVRLLDDELELVENVGTNSVASHERLRKNALHIVSLLQAGFYAGLISEMNYDVLREEFMALLKKLSETPSDSEQQAIFPQTFFDVEEQASSPSSPQSNASAADAHRTYEHEHKTSHTTPQSDRRAPRTPETPHVSSKGHDKSHALRSTTDAPKNSEIKSDRQSVIIDIIRRKKRVSIKDITSEISGCSEKTIQRELGTLVEKGVLNKVGERRWSRYVLA